MFLASKFEDVYCLQLWELLEVNKQKKEEFISFENLLFTELNFSIPNITSYSFLLQYLNLNPDLDIIKIHNKCLHLLRKPKFQIHIPSKNALNAISFVKKHYK